MVGIEEKIDGLGKVAPEIYEDGLKPAVQESGKTIAVIPQAINAALAPLRKWIAQKEYNVAETERLLAKKLERIDAEKITTPDAYVAVPAIQALTYCMDSEELREMYSSLLATSMVDDEKWKVHPSFVEVIKQLSPDEAKLLRKISEEGSAQPLIDIRIIPPGGGFITQVHNLSLLANGLCDNPNMIYAYIDNLARLKLIDIPDDQYFMSDEPYKELESYSEVRELMERPLPDGHKWEIKRKKFDITNYGKSFIDVCLGQEIEI